jgi:PHD/YefM family antitoxin component YafN of YafNO toxin-antitoxin module
MTETADRLGLLASATAAGMRRSVAVQTYHVTASRGADHLWIFQCREFPRALARARSLSDAYLLMPDEIATAARVDPASVAVDLVPDCAAVPLDEAQAALPDLVAEAAGQEIYLTRNHEAVAVLLSADRYERTLDRVKELEESLADAREVNGRAEVRTPAPVVYDA